MLCKCRLLESHKNVTIRIEMDEMRNFYHDKKHQIWLWRVIYRGSGEVITFLFGRGNIRILANCWNCLSRLTQGMSMPMATARITSGCRQRL
jgi:IS1 family transposase